MAQKVRIKLFYQNIIPNSYALIDFFTEFAKRLNYLLYDFWERNRDNLLDTKFF